MYMYIYVYIVYVAKSTSYEGHHHAVSQRQHMYEILQLDLPVSARIYVAQICVSEKYPVERFIIHVSMCLQLTVISYVYLYRINLSC
jgi:hypothetical protein